MCIRDRGNVLGICNGFQILCESGLLPGVLLRNANMQFVCKNVFIKNEGGEVIKIPIAHGEGRYYADAETLEKLSSQKQILYRYCDEKGDMNENLNPNGSTENIAGICNKQRLSLIHISEPTRPY